MTSPLARLKSLIKSSSGANNAQDVRGRRFVAVIDCILNQNARDAGAAEFPAMNFELLQLCHDHHVGVLQMPCPEIAVLGIERTRRPGQKIREALDTEAGRQGCARLAGELADRIAAYHAEGYLLMAVLGGNPGSPGCAVHHGDTGLAAESGVFMKELRAAFDKRDLRAPFRGIRDHDPQLLAQDLLWLRQLITGTSEQEPRK